MQLQLTGTSGYACVALLGGCVGAIELAGRYRDDPLLSVRTSAGLFYLLVNMAASAAALGVVRTMGWNFGQEALIPKNLVQVMAAGLGAITLFRARLFNATRPTGEGYGSAGAATYSWSPGGLLDRLLRVVDAQVSRAQAKQRVRVTRQVMTRLSFEKASVALPAFALGLLEHADEAEQQGLRDDVDALCKSDELSDGVKLRLLGVAVMRFTGPKLLRRAVDGLGEEIFR